MTVLFLEQHVTLGTRVKILFWSRNPLIFFPSSLGATLYSKTSGWSLWCTSTLSQTIGSVSLPKGRKLEEQETVVSRFFSNVVYFFSWPSYVTKCSSVLSQNESYCSYLYLESKGSRLSISQTLGNLDLLIFLFTQNKFTFITSYFTRK